MKKLKSIPAMILALILLAGICPAAQAEVMTLGVYFCGQVTQADGTTQTVRLEGTFRVMQNGLEIGRIAAGGETLLVTGTDAVTVEPLPETIDPAWDLSGAACEITVTDGTVIVPIVVRPRAETEPEPSATEENTEQSGQAGPSEEITANSDGTAPTAEPAEATAVPTAETTPVPEIAPAQAGADSGAVRVRAFVDSNNNGEFGLNEQGASKIALYMVAADGTLVASAVTGSDGMAVLDGLEPGTYRLRAVLPEEMIFSKASKRTGIDSSCMGLSSEGTQDSAPMTVKKGETLETAVGVQKGLTVSGTCWLDENGDGIMGRDESRVAGARITMKGQKNGLEFETFSGENGEWKITRVRAGFYDLTSYVPDGMMFTRYSKTGGKNRSIFTAEGKTRSTKTLDTNDGKSETDQNIGFTRAATISGICFLDENYNGLYDEGEPTLAGVKLTATKQAKEEDVATAQSGEDGTYLLTGLRGNTYRIRALLPDDGSDFTMVSQDPAGNHFKSRDNRRENFLYDFVILDGEQRMVNVGAIYYGSVSGTVYMDSDFSATKNGKEKAAQGIQVTLKDADGNTVDTKQTSAKGEYTFSGLVPGTYSLRMTARAGYAFTRTGEGNVMLNLNRGEGYSEPFRVAIGTAVTGMDAGMIEPATVEGAVFADRNDNGLRDAGEEGLTGTVVRLMSEEGEAFSAEIGKDGEFLFDAVMPGKYYLRYELPETGIFAKLTAGGNEISGEDGAGQTEWFSIATADHREGPVCGGLTLGRIAGTVFRDHDGSGIRTEDEEPVSGAEIELIPAREDLEPLLAKTGADGTFLLADLHPDQYTIRVTLPDGLVTSRLPGTDLPLTAGMAEQRPEIEISMGEIREDQQISAVLPAKLSGQVWLDENNNGRMEPEEKTPKGTALTIQDEETGSVFATLTTDEEGRFSAAGMIPGRFTVFYGLDAESDSAPAGDSTFAKEGNRLIMKGMAFGEGESRDDLLMGLVRFTSLAGTAWIDRGGTVENLAGVTVLLENAEGEKLQDAVTGEDGTYRFSGLMPGDYRIRAELPEGYLAAEPDDERLQNGLISVMTETSGRKGASDLISLRMSEDQLKLNLGSVLPGTIGDYCWLDENENGWQDGGEYGIPGVRIELQRNGVTVAETVSDQYGLYWFREVYPAVYTLKITPPEEIKPTQKRTDIYLIVSSVNETEDAVCFTDPIAVQSDVTNFNVDLGFVLRKAGVYPPGYGEGKKMDWSLTYEPKN